MTEAPAYVFSHAFEQERSILLVIHDDGDWQFLCGGVHEAVETPRAEDTTTEPTTGYGCAALFVPEPLGE